MVTGYGAAPTASAAPPVTAPVAVAPNVPIGPATTTPNTESITSEIPSSTANRTAFLEKIKQIQGEAVIPPAGKVKRTSAEVAAAETEQRLNAGQRQLVNLVQGGKVPVDEFHAFQNDVNENIFGGKPPIGKSGAIQNVDQITNHIELNKDKFPTVWQNWQNIKEKHPKQSGAAQLGMLFNLIGLSGLAAEGVKASKTGDWSDFGLGAVNQAVANLAPRASLPTALMTYSKNVGESPEELKALGERLKAAQQAYKYGAGRGSVGIAPP